MNLVHFDKKSKPHKFFYRDLNFDLNEVINDLQVEYNRIAEGKMRGVKVFDHEHPEREFFKESKSISTIKSREYNAFQMYYPWMQDLYSAVVDMVREACAYYGVDYTQCRFLTQSWFNINNSKNGGKLDWHDHVDDRVQPLAFHGYFCVSAEPSETHYNIDNEIKINKNKNNRAILSLVGYPHAMADWEWEGPRITIAYDVMPLDMLMQKDFLRAAERGSGVNDDLSDKTIVRDFETFWEQHYFPLPRFI